MSEPVLGWGVCVTLPHFLATLLQCGVKTLPPELLLPDVSKMYIPQGSTVAVHDILKSYLPANFGETQFSGLINYRAPVEGNMMYVVTRNGWFLAHNARNVILSHPNSGDCDRVGDVLNFGCSVFTEPFPPALFTQDTVFCSDLLTERELLLRVEDKQNPLTPSAVFEKAPTGKYGGVRGWFQQYGDSIARSTQFNTPQGTVVVTSSPTGGEVVAYTSLVTHPRTVTFYPYSEERVRDLVAKITGREV